MTDVCVVADWSFVRSGMHVAAFGARRSLLSSQPQTNPTAPEGFATNSVWETERVR